MTSYRAGPNILPISSFLMDIQFLKMTLNPSPRFFLRGSARLLYMLGYIALENAWRDQEKVPSTVCTFALLSLTIKR